MYVYVYVYIFTIQINTYVTHKHIHETVKQGKSICILSLYEKTIVVQSISKVST